MHLTPAPAPRPEQPAPETVTPELALEFSRIALENVEREYPYMRSMLITKPEPMPSIRELNPVFFGAFDWHSCVHMHWLLVRCLRSCPELETADQIRSVMDDHFAPEKMAREVEFFQDPGRKHFSRPYGWAWLLKLSAELETFAGTSQDAARWRDSLAPLTQQFVARYEQYFPIAPYPDRVGFHGNTAFALLLGLDYAQAARNTELQSLCMDKALLWYQGDLNAPVLYEPGSVDFLSPALVEHALMARVLPTDAYQQWSAKFFPWDKPHDYAHLLQPATVADRADPTLAHLDGLNISRAWCWRMIANSFAADDPRTVEANAAAAKLLQASLPHINGEYMGSHWLASFAALALTTKSQIS